MVQAAFVQTAIPFSIREIGSEEWFRCLQDICQFPIIIFPGYRFVIRDQIEWCTV